MNALLLAYLATALAMALLASLGLATAKDFSPATLDTIFFLAFVPSVLVGLCVAGKRAVQDMQGRKQG